MEAHQIRYFLSACDSLNFSQAAKGCGVAVSTLTRAVKTLEDELGGQLFRRERHLNPPHRPRPADAAAPRLRPGGDGGGEERRAAPPPARRRAEARRHLDDAERAPRRLPARAAGRFGEAPAPRLGEPLRRAWAGAAAGRDRRRDHEPAGLRRRPARDAAAARELHDRLSARPSLRADERRPAARAGRRALRQAAALRVSGELRAAWPRQALP
jgi:hypothetical protein